MNKKGFVLIETLVVTIFTLVTFTILYNSAVPLLGKYKELSYYDDLDTTYDLYHISNLVKNDSRYNELINNHYKSITCTNNTLNDQSACYELFEVLKIDLTSDEVIFLNTNYISELENDTTISDDIKNYLEYINVAGNIIILQNDGYVSYLNLTVTSEKIKDSIEKSVCENISVTDSDGIIYLSGTNDCINFNYIWYSGKLWRITALYPDGRMKLVTEDLIASMAWGDTSYFYNQETNIGSQIYQFLNEEFLDTLYNHQNIINVNQIWDASVYEEINSEAYRTSKISSKVGMLNINEYVKSYETLGNEMNGYLNTNYEWWLLNPSLWRSDVSVSWLVYNDGSLGINHLKTNYSLRPSIVLKSTIKFSDGDGSKNNPYRLVGDLNTVQVNDKLNTRQSGEYINFDGDLYRIVEIDSDGYIKLVKDDYIYDESGTILSKTLPTTGYGTGVDDTSWDYYLNNTWYNSITSKYQDMIVNHDFYIGDTNYDYKQAICLNPSDKETIKECEKITTVYSGKIGLPRFGELFSSQLVERDGTRYPFYLITKSYGYNFIVDDFGPIDWFEDNHDKITVKPTFYIDEYTQIISGNGTKNNPYEIYLHIEE